MKPFIFQWRELNRREQHCRLEGRILGKLQLYPGDTSYECFIYAPSMRYVGARIQKAKARLFVEKSIKRLADKIQKAQASGVHLKAARRFSHLRG